MTSKAASKTTPALDGLLIVDKPGMEQTGTGTSQYLPTSHDIVQRVRRWSGQRRIGHTGTLDPMASGVLVLCLGAATRLVEYYQGHPKQYEAEIVLGIATDTYDAVGEVVERAPIPDLTVDKIESILEHFRGEIWQTPPVYSALKQGGESLHRKARRGEEVEVPARRITFYKLELLSFTPPDRIRLRAICSPGTYMRSLAHDLGHALGSVGHLARLRRESAGPFTLAQAHSLDSIAAAAQEGRLADLLLPLGVGLEMPRLTLDAAVLQRLGYGQTVALATPPDFPVAPARDLLAQAWTEEGRFAGILRCLGAAQPPAIGAIWKAEKWLALPETG